MKKAGYVAAMLLFVWAFCSAQQSRNVVIAVIDGARYSETLGDTLHRYIPNIWNELRPLGTIFTKFYVDGTTTTNPGHATILTGTWQTINNDGTQRPSSPTVFEYHRKETGSAQSENYVVLGKDKLNILSYGNHGAYGQPYGASVKTSSSQYDDGRTLANFFEVAAAAHPRLSIINFAGTDNAGHSGSWSTYLSALRRADSLTQALYTFIQSDSVYNGSTTLIVVNDHGRHLDGVSDGFRSHGDGCDGCRHIMLLMIGPGITAGSVDTTRRAQIDIAPTVGVLMGFPTPFTSGTPIGSVLVTQAKEQRDVFPGVFAVGQNYPNPFNPQTVIPFTLAAASDVVIRVYDVAGREVGPVFNRSLEAGDHRFQWSGADLSTGVYMYRITARSADGSISSESGRMMLLR